MIEKVESHEYSKVANILTSAFIDDPVFSWFMRKDNKKWTALENMFHTTIDKFYTKSIVYKDTSSNGASIWVDSQDIPSGLSIGMKIRFIYNVYKWTTLGGISRFFDMVEMGEEHHPKEPHHYLYVIGVKPEAQGKGIGTKLLQHHLDILDQKGIPAYLENSNKKNNEFYRRHGFKEINEMNLDEDGTSLWGMWRTPK